MVSKSMLKLGASLGALAVGFAYGAVKERGLRRRCMQSLEVKK